MCNSRERGNRFTRAEHFAAKKKKKLYSKFSPERKHNEALSHDYLTTSPKKRTEKRKEEELKGATKNALAIES